MSDQTKLVATSRALPLPEVTKNGVHLAFTPCPAGTPVPDDARAYLSTALDPVDSALIASMPESVGLIANLGVGYDNIDLAAAAARGIVVTNTPVVTEDTADLAFALILAACRRLGEGERYLRSGAWEKGAASPALGTRVNGAVLGIVGFGAIGQAVARRAVGFDMRILYHCPRENTDAAARYDASYCESIGDLMAQADIVSLHAPLTEATRGMIGEAELAACKKGAVLVNTARGPLVDEEALIAALSNGQLGAAGLDVFTHEPRVPETLMTMENVVLTPHIGSATVACRTDIIQRGVANILAFVSSGEVFDPVPLP